MLHLAAIKSKIARATRGTMDLTVVIASTVQLERTKMSQDQISAPFVRLVNMSQLRNLSAVQPVQHALQQHTRRRIAPTA